MNEEYVYFTEIDLKEKEYILMIWEQEGNAFEAIVYEYEINDSNRSEIEKMLENGNINQTINKSKAYKLTGKIMEKEIKNEMKIEFLSKSANEAFARITVAAFFSQLDPTIEELSDIKTAISEAVTNSIIHGYEERQGIVKLICKIKSKM